MVVLQESYRMVKYRELQIDRSIDKHRTRRTYQEVSNESQAIAIVHPPLEVRPPGLDVEARFSRAKWQIIIFAIQRSGHSWRGFVLEVRSPLRYTVSCWKLIRFYRGRRTRRKLPEYINTSNWGAVDSWNGKLEW